MTSYAEDRAAIAQLFADYCWLVDGGDGDGWAALWTEDGAFTGIPDPLHGRDQLRLMPPGFHDGFGGKLRHHITNLSVKPAGDSAAVRAYSVVTDWREGGKLMSFAKVEAEVVRRPDGWKIARLHADMG
jgi:ketosteroid isomerase-like protein